jgi:predicted RNA binding protein YcfA (HicA-like mRNA interferase family)
MPKGRSFSGVFVISILVKEFGFAVVSQRGSHVKLRAGSRVTVVPLHKELAPGTFAGVLRLAGVSKEEFLKVL